MKNVIIEWWFGKLIFSESYSDNFLKISQKDLTQGNINDAIKIEKK